MICHVIIIFAAWLQMAWPGSWFLCTAGYYILITWISLVLVEGSSRKWHSTNFVMEVTLFPQFFVYLFHIECYFCSWYNEMSQCQYRILCTSLCVSVSVLHTLYILMHISVSTAYSVHLCACQCQYCILCTSLCMSVSVLHTVYIFMHISVSTAYFVHLYACQCQYCILCTSLCMSVSVLHTLYIFMHVSVSTAWFNTNFCVNLYACFIFLSELFESIIIWILCVFTKIKSKISINV